jgi:hypothetical protein
MEELVLKSNIQEPTALTTAIPGQSIEQVVNQLASQLIPFSLSTGGMSWSPGRHGHNPSVKRNLAT